MVADALGILIGGKGSRMGGIAKGLLKAPSGETIVARLSRIAGELALRPVLIGERPEYAGSPLERIRPPSLASMNRKGFPGTVTIPCWSG